MWTCERHYAARQEGEEGAGGGGYLERSCFVLLEKCGQVFSRDVSLGAGVLVSVRKHDDEIERRVAGE